METVPSLARIQVDVKVATLMKIIKNSPGVLMASIATTLLCSCGKASLPRKGMQQVRELMTQQGRLEWFSAAARAAIQLNDNPDRDKSLQQIESQMPGLPGHTAFSCWIRKEATTDEDILYGSWHTGLTSAGVIVGGTNFTPSTVAWPRYRFERLTNGVYIFYISI